MKKILAAAALLGLSAGLSAQELNWNYAELGYARSTSSSDLWATGVNASYSPINHLALRAGVARAEFGSSANRANRASLGVLGYIPLAQGTDLFASLDRSRDRIRVGGLGGFTANSWDYEVGVRNAWGANVETELATNYADYSGSGGEWGARVDGRYNFNNTWAVGLGYGYTRNSSNTVGANVRLSF